MAIKVPYRFREFFAKISSEEEFCSKFNNSFISGIEVFLKPVAVVYKSDFFKSFFEMVDGYGFVSSLGGS